MIEAEDDDAFDASIYSRGAVKHTQTLDTEQSDSCGMWERGHPVVFQVATRQGEFDLPYSGWRGTNHMRKDGRLVKFVMKIHAALDFDGEAVERYFALTVTGDRLDKVMRNLRLGTRTTLHESGRVEDKDKPEITGIELAVWEA